MKKTAFTLADLFKNPTPLLKILFLSSLATSQILQADTCPPCPSSNNTCQSFFNFDCLDGQFTLQGDWLFWKTRRCDLNFAMNQAAVDPTVTPTNSEFAGIKPNFESGYRIGGYYKTKEGTTFSARYSHFDQQKGHLFTNTESPFLVNRAHPSLFTEASYADASYTIDYDMVELEKGVTLQLDQNSTLYAFSTTRFGWTDEKMTTTYADSPLLADASSTTTVFQKNDFNSIGVGLGVELQKEIFCGIGFYGRSTINLMFTDYKLYFTETNSVIDGDLVTITTPIDTKMKEECILPLIEIAAGLHYGLNLCGFDIFATGGYEFVSWIGAKDFLNFVDASQEASITRNKTNLGFEGFFFRLGASF